MDDTLTSMDYFQVDILTAGQLEVDDLIRYDDDVVSIVSIISLPDGYTIEVVNDFGERFEIDAEEYQKFPLMMLGDL
jgi:hypothetical protein